MIMRIAEHKGGIMKRYIFEFGVYEFHPHYILAHPSEGAIAGRYELGVLSEIVSAHYRTPFGFIANRVNHSSTDLTIYKRIMKLHPQLKVISIVSYRPLTSILAETERYLLKGLHFKIFYELSAAQKWTLEMLGIK